jgi:hypothetical protein
MVFFVVLEILADEFNIQDPGICRFSAKKLRKNCQISGRKLSKILHFFNEKAQKNLGSAISFYVQFDNDHLIISCPKFKKLTDEYTRKKMQILKSKNPDKIRSLSSKVPLRQQTTDNRQQTKVLNRDGENSQPGFLFEKNNMGGALEEIINRCERIEQLKTQIPKEINIYAWVQDKINTAGHPAAILESLDMLIARWPGVDSPWAYTTAIFQLKNGNYWENEHIEQAKQFKEHWSSSDEIMNLIKNIGSEGSENGKMVF